MEAQPDLFAIRSIALTAARATDKRRDGFLRNRFCSALLAALLLPWLGQLPESVPAFSFSTFFASLLALSREASRELWPLTKCKPLDNAELAYHQEEPGRKYDSKKVLTRHSLAAPVAF